MNEKEIFLRYAEMMGYDISQKPNGAFANQRVSDMFAGWLARADVQRAMEHSNASAAIRQVSEIIARGPKP